SGSATHAPRPASATTADSPSAPSTNGTPAGSIRIGVPILRGTRDGPCDAGPVGVLPGAAYSSVRSRNQPRPWQKDGKVTRIGLADAGAGCPPCGPSA